MSWRMGLGKYICKLVFKGAKSKWKLCCWRWWRMKWQTISMCLVCSWKTLLLAMWMVLQLSQWIGELVAWGAPISVRSQRNQMSLEAASVRARYSTSVLKRVTTNCFLLRQDIRDELRKIIITNSRATVRGVLLRPQPYGQTQALHG